MVVFTLLDHPLLSSYTDRLRSSTTGTEEVRQLLRQIAQLMLPFATQDLPTTEISISTPLQETRGVQITGGSPVLISVLRAGNGLLDGVLTLLPDADIGYIGLARNHETLEAEEYLVKLPDVSNRRVLIVDPMLATGHTAVATLERVMKGNPAEITMMNVVASPEGVAHVEAHHPEVHIVCAALDSGLNDSGYILPGLGDAGDRLYGTQ